MPLPYKLRERLCVGIFVISSLIVFLYLCNVFESKEERAKRIKYWDDLVEEVRREEFEKDARSWHEQMKREQRYREFIQNGPR